MSSSPLQKRTKPSSEGPVRFRYLSNYYETFRLVNRHGKRAALPFLSVPFLGTWLISVPTAHVRVDVTGSCAALTVVLMAIGFSASWSRHHR